MVKINSAIFGLLGVITGGLITFLTSYVTTRMQINQSEKTASESIELEKSKLNREEDFKKLNLLYKPALMIYGKNENQKGIMIDFYGEEFSDNGLLEKNAKKLIDLIDNNLELVELEILDIYTSVKYDYEFDENINAQYKSHGKNYDIYNSFDTDLKLHNIILEKARDIEEKYNHNP